MSRKSDAQAEVRRAKQAARDNWDKNSGRNQAVFEHAIDVAEKLARKAK